MRGTAIKPVSAAATGSMRQSSAVSMANAGFSSFRQMARLSPVRRAGLIALRKSYRFRFQLFVNATVLAIDTCQPRVEYAKRLRSSTGPKLKGEGRHEYKPEI